MKYYYNLNSLVVFLTIITLAFFFFLILGKPLYSTIHICYHKIYFIIILDYIIDLDKIVFKCINFLYIMNKRKDIYNVVKYSILNKHFSFELIIHQRILKNKCITISTKILGSIAVFIIDNNQNKIKHSEQSNT